MELLSVKYDMTEHIVSEMKYDCEEILRSRHFLNFPWGDMITIDGSDPNIPLLFMYRMRSMVRNWLIDKPLFSIGFEP